MSTRPEKPQRHARLVRVCHREQSVPPRRFFRLRGVILLDCRPSRIYSPLPTPHHRLQRGTSIILPLELCFFARTSKRKTATVTQTAAIEATVCTGFRATCITDVVIIRPDERTCSHKNCDLRYWDCRHIGEARFRFGDLVGQEFHLPPKRRRDRTTGGKYRSAR
jgi:hypothetical protein